MGCCPRHAHPTLIAGLQIAKYLRHQLEDVLVKYGVDVVASGHVHAYSRSCPVIGKHCVPFKQGSVLHVITGSAGRKLSKVKNHQPHWVASAQYAWGFSRFTVRTSLPPKLMPSLMHYAIRRRE